MNSFTKWAIAAAAVAIVAIVGYSLLPSRGGVGNVPPSPSASPSLSASPSPIQIGKLAPGTYAVPISGTDVTVHVTVPAGWEWGDAHTLFRSDAGPLESHYIGFWSGSVQPHQDPCRWHGAQQLTGKGARAVVDALAAVPMNAATNPNERQATSPDAGRIVWPGWEVQTSVPADLDISTCDDGQYRLWGPEDLNLQQFAPGQRNHDWVIDTPSGKVIAVVVGSFPGTPARTISEIEGIVASMRFSEG